jgi:hypothetical protein
MLPILTAGTPTWIFFNFVWPKIEDGAPRETAISRNNKHKIIELTRP